jgi:hypothetical protein
MLLTVGAAPVWAQDLPDPLHGCIIGTNCGDNGIVTPVNANPLPNFTFTASAGPLTGDFLVEILIPDDAANAASLSFSISGTSGGAGDNTTIGPVSSALMGHWTGGNLGDFLGLSASPNNPISAWLPYTQAHGDAGANGFDVYQVDLGVNELQSPSNPTMPVLTLAGSDLPIASLLTAFLSQGSSYISTANSGAIFEESAPGGVGTLNAPVAELYSIVMLGTILLGMGAAMKKRLRSRRVASPQD